MTTTASSPTGSLSAPALGRVGPNWFASVMGTGIVAVVLVGLPFPLPGAAAVAVGFWVLAALLLVGLGTATLLHHLLHPEIARGHRDHPTMAHFYGAPAMALMTVGAGAVLVGAPGALAVDAVLWSAGTVLGLATTVLVPLRLRRAGHLRAADAVPAWLMPVVPLMVSAATGPLLVAELAGTARAALLVACWACFAVSLTAFVVVGALVVRRLASTPLPAASVPTLFIVLGPLGQSVTAVHHLATVGPGDVLALAYGVPVWLLGVGWASYALVVTLRTARDHLPFGLPWWSFTFPLGTLVTGTSGLASITGLSALAVASGVLAAALLAVWVLVAARTASAVADGLSRA